MAPKKASKIQTVSLLQLKAQVDSSAKPLPSHSSCEAKPSEVSWRINRTESKKPRSSFADGSQATPEGDWRTGARDSFASGGGDFSRSAGPLRSFENSREGESLTRSFTDSRNYVIESNWREDQRSSDQNETFVSMKNKPAAAMRRTNTTTGNNFSSEFGPQRFVGSVNFQRSSSVVSKDEAAPTAGVYVAPHKRLTDEKKAEIEKERQERERQERERQERERQEKERQERERQQEREMRERERREKEKQEKEEREKQQKEKAAQKLAAPESDKPLLEQTAYHEKLKAVKKLGLQLNVNKSRMLVEVLKFRNEKTEVNFSCIKALQDMLVSTINAEEPPYNVENMFTDILTEKEKTTILPSFVVAKVLIFYVYQSATKYDDVADFVQRIKPTLVKIFNESFIHGHKLLFLIETTRICNCLKSHKLDESWGIIESIWDCLYMEEIIEEQYFHWWMDLEDDETGGRQVALIQTIHWFSWLKQFDEEKSNLQMESEESEEEDFAETKTLKRTVKFDAV